MTDDAAFEEKLFDILVNWRPQAERRGSVYMLDAFLSDYTEAQARAVKDVVATPVFYQRVDAIYDEAGGSDIGMDFGASTNSPFKVLMQQASTFLCHSDSVFARRNAEVASRHIFTKFANLEHGRGAPKRLSKEDAKLMIAGLAYMILKHHGLEDWSALARRVGRSVPGDEAAGSESKRASRKASWVDGPSEEADRDIDAYAQAAMIALHTIENPIAARRLSPLEKAMSGEWWCDGEQTEKGTFVTGTFATVQEGSVELQVQAGIDIEDDCMCEDEQKVSWLDWAKKLLKATGATCTCGAGRSLKFQYEEPPEPPDPS